MSNDLPLPKLISVDDHVVEPPTLWTDRLPRKYVDVMPRVERSHINLERLEETTRGGSYDYSRAFSDDPNDAEVDVWRFEDDIVPNLRLGASAGFSRDEMKPLPITFDAMRPACIDPRARLEDMDMAGIEASLCFPNMFVRFCGQRFLHAKDKDLALLCVRAYNDWIVDDWSGLSGGRLLPLTILPLWDVDLSIAELRRNAARGVRAVAFSELPTHLGLPSIYVGHWDRLFAACNETKTVLNMHIGSSSQMPSTSPDAPAAVGSGLTFVNAAGSLLDWLFSGLLIQFPDLKLSFAESQIGWLPYILERADVVWDYNREWNNVGSALAVPPSQLYRDHVFCCFFNDAHGLDSIDAIGADTVVFETDYPHADSTWPYCQEVAIQITKDLDAETREKVLRGNAIRMLGLEL